MNLKSCIDCREAYEPDDDFSKRCDSCSLKRTSSPEPTRTYTPDERDRLDEWDRERIKKDWSKAAATSRAIIMAKYNASK